jgi:hypothetical protein
LFFNSRYFRNDYSNTFWKKWPCVQVISPSVSSSEELKQSYLTLRQTMKYIRDCWNDRWYQAYLWYFICSWYITLKVPWVKISQKVWKSETETIRFWNISERKSWIDPKWATLYILTSKVLPLTILKRNDWQ